jgi:hypothetical protein
MIKQLSSQAAQVHEPLAGTMGVNATSAVDKAHVPSAPQNLTAAIPEHAHRTGAFSDTHGEFRDFVLARVRGMPLVLSEVGMAANGDTLWHIKVAVQVVPHPGLPAAQQALITADSSPTQRV